MRSLGTHENGLQAGSQGKRMQNLPSNPTKSETNKGPKTNMPRLDVDNKTYTLAAVATVKASVVGRLPFSFALFFARRVAFASELALQLRSLLTFLPKLVTECGSASGFP